MSKRNTSWNEEKIARYLKEGRGQGELSNYKPWINIQDFGSSGRVHRLKGWKTNRIHHLLSDLERNYFYALEWADEVIDIREQFPLDRHLTSVIAEEKDINHPEDQMTRTPLVMTTDFLITARKNKEVIHLARTVKPSNELSNQRVIKKFEIEREYWKRKGVSWSVFTEQDVPRAFIDNMQWLHSAKDKLKEIDDHLISLFYDHIYDSTLSITKILNEFETNYGTENGTAILILKYLLANKYVTCDIKQKIKLSNHADIFTFPERIFKERLAK